MNLLHAYPSPVGSLWFHWQNGSLVRLFWHEPEHIFPIPPLLAQWLDSYFASQQPAFCLPLSPQGTIYQQRVWQALTTIPWGTTITYGHLAQQLASGARAVGQAVAANPLPILIPCHRVVGSQNLGGYSGAGGLLTKQTLLQLEQT